MLVDRAEGIIECDPPDGANGILLCLVPESGI